MDEAAVVTDCAVAGLVDALVAPVGRSVRAVPTWPPVRAAARWVEQARVVAVRLARPPSGAGWGDVCLITAGGDSGRGCVRG